MKLWGQPTKGRSKDRSVIGTKGESSEHNNELDSSLDRFIAEETARQTRELLSTRGWCLWQCQALGGDIIAVVSNADVEGIPEGLAIYTEAELEELFNRYKAVDPATLRLIHEAKRHGAVVTDVTQGGDQ